MKERGSVRKAIALTAAAGLLVTLAGCTVSAPSGACEPIGPGDASSLVSASGAFGAEPTVTFPTPLKTDVVEVSVLDEGDGKTIYTNDFVSLTYTVFDPETGEQGSPTSTGFLIASTDSDAQRLFTCLSVGSRIAAILPATEATDTEGATVASLLLIDIDSAYTSRATGRVEMPAQGLPSVVTAPDGHPGITIVGDVPPTTLESSTLITGTGAEIAAGDNLLLQYSIVEWESRREVASTWSNGSYPQARLFSKYDATTSEGINNAALTALEGATVGSQVLVVMPPSTWAGADITATEGSTLVVVYDVLAVLD